MNVFNSVKYEGFAEMGKNPASVEMGTKDLILNRDEFPKLPKFTQKFIIEHEKGHLLYDTDDEQRADEHALKSLYKTEHKSLKKSIKALVDFLPDGDPRIENLYNEALKIDKGENNMRQRIDFNSFLRGATPTNLRTLRRNADGDCDDDLDCEGEGCLQGRKSGRRQQKRYVDFFGYQMTPAEIAILIICGFMILKFLK
jgi:hypothetical protein